MSIQGNTGPYGTPSDFFKSMPNDELAKLDIKSVHLLSVGGGVSMHSALVFEAEDGRVILYRGGPEFTPKTGLINSPRYMGPDALHRVADNIHRVAKESKFIPSIITKFAGAARDTVVRADFGRCIASMVQLNAETIDRTADVPKACRHFKRTPKILARQQLFKKNMRADDMTPDRVNYQKIEANAGIKGMQLYWGRKFVCLSEDKTVAQTLFDKCTGIKDLINENNVKYRAVPKSQTLVESKAEVLHAPETNSHGIMGFALQEADEALAKTGYPERSLRDAYLKTAPRVPGATESKLFPGVTLEELKRQIHTKTHAQPEAVEKTIPQSKLRLGSQRAIAPKM